MKKETKLILRIIGLIIAIVFLIWGAVIMRNYDGYLEIMKAARRTAAPQFIIGYGLLIGAYLIGYKK